MLVLLPLLASCSRVLVSVPDQPQRLVLARDAVIQPCRVSDTTLSTWFTANTALCLRFGPWPTGGAVWLRLPAGSRLRVVERRDLRLIDGEDVLYRLQLPKGYPRPQRPVYVNENLMKLNRVLQQKPAPSG